MTFISFVECFWNLEKPECDEDEEVESDSCLPESDWAKVWISEKGQRLFLERWFEAPGILDAQCKLNKFWWKLHLLLAKEPL